jgi:hypothetical protein
MQIKEDAIRITKDIKMLLLGKPPRNKFKSSFRAQRYYNEKVLVKVERAL